MKTPPPSKKSLLEKSADELNLHHLIKRVNKKPGGGGIGKGSSTTRPFRHNRAPEKPKSRKELRKEKRKAGKAEKHNYILKRFGKLDKVKEEGDKGSSSDKKRKGKKKRTKKKKKKKQNKDTEGEEDGGTSASDVQVQQKSSKKIDPKTLMDRNAINKSEADQEFEELKKEMEVTRKRRIMEENKEEDKVIRQLGKKLKLKKGSKIPESFRTDGLDYLLEFCESLEKKKKAKYDEEEEEDLGKKRDKNSLSKSKSESYDDEEDDEDDDDMDSFDEDDEEVGDEEDDDLELDEGSEEEENEEDLDLEGEDDDEGINSDDNEIEEEEENDSDLEQEEETEKGVNEDSEDLEDSEIDDEMNIDLDEDDDLSDEEIGEEDQEQEDEESSSPKVKAKKSKKKKKDDGIWEDIYGRLRGKDGSIIDEKSLKKSDDVDKKNASVSSSAGGKYVPPMLRKNQSQRDKIMRSLTGLFNRLSETNMSSISKQVEVLYMENSRNEMNEIMLELLYAALLRPVRVPERAILEHIMLVSILHANVGTEIGGFFLQKFVEDFKSKYDAQTDPEYDNKELENLLLLITTLYHFKVVDCNLIYDILKMLAANFQPKDVELILAALRSVGFRLRKDDPVELKALIILIQQKASESKSQASSAKVKFMLEIVAAIRNNNMTKIPNYDPSVGQHLLKMLKPHIHKGNYVSALKIKMEDLLNAGSKGRWWIVGSAWSKDGTANSEQQSSLMSTATTASTAEEKEQNEKLLAKARSLGMNTETRRTVFCILMTAEDYVDAFEKLDHLDLRNNQEREIIHVATYCCLHEKKFNPYYALVVSKFCAIDRKYMLTLQYNLWDRLKDLNSLKSYQLTNLVKLMVHLINDKSLPLSSLKVIEYTEMDKPKLTFLKQTLHGILLQKDEDNIQEIFLKTAGSEKLHIFRESLRLFMGHFLLQTNVITSDGENVGCDLDEEEMELLRGRVKIAESAMSLGHNRVQL